ncbi:Hypothetical_protein [Hexamita inflata]|uniref:Hypothetical_protein n=1 Tax=Hexamita inflata TaxID=28002 RepID=A0AA86PIX8_9EUKA|nr:Hypothetical protein HINF_LOCUS24082 [Hexamita inflata]
MNANLFDTMQFLKYFGGQQPNFMTTSMEQKQWDEQCSEVSLTVNTYNDVRIMGLQQKFTSGYLGRVIPIYKICQYKSLQQTVQLFIQVGGIKIFPLLSEFLGGSNSQEFLPFELLNVSVQFAFGEVEHLGHLAQRHFVGVHVLDDLLQFVHRNFTLHCIWCGTICSDMIIQVDKAIVMVIESLIQQIFQCKIDYPMLFKWNRSTQLGVQLCSLNTFTLNTKMCKSVIKNQFFIIIQFYLMVQLRVK